MQHGPLPPLPFPLPPEFDAALNRKYAVVTDMRAQIKQGVLDDARRQQLQASIQVRAALRHARASHGLAQLEQARVLAHPIRTSPNPHLPITLLTIILTPLCAHTCTQAHFRDYLHSSGSIRQVYDLSKLEQDEGTGMLVGGSPLLAGLAVPGSLASSGSMSPLALGPGAASSFFGAGGALSPLGHGNSGGGDEAAPAAPGPADPSPMGDQ